MILVSNKGKIFTERQDEILDIVNNGVLNYAFINILNISFSDFFGVDVNYLLTEDIGTEVLE